MAELIYSAFFAYPAAGTDNERTWDHGIFIPGSSSAGNFDHLLFDRINDFVKVLVNTAQIKIFGNSGVAETYY